MGAMWRSVLRTFLQVQPKPLIFCSMSDKPNPLSEYFKELGRKGGSSTSEKKKKAAKANAKKALAARLKRIP